MNGFISPTYNRHETIFDRKIEDAAYRDWLCSESQGQEDAGERVINLLRLALQAELSDKQLSYLVLYYRDRLTLSEIGEMYGVGKSTVSRTISRAKKNLEGVLRYADKRLLVLSFQRKGTYGRYNTKKRKAQAAP